MGKIKFKLGDRVWHMVYGWGLIEAMWNDGTISSKLENNQIIHEPSYTFFSNSFEIPQSAFE